MNATIRAVTSDPSQTAFGFQPDGCTQLPRLTPDSPAIVFVSDVAPLLSRQKGQKIGGTSPTTRLKLARLVLNLQFTPRLNRYCWSRTGWPVPELTIVVSSQTKLSLMMQESSTLCERRTVRFERSLSEVWETNIRPM